MEAVHDQDRIGWGSAFEGRWASKWTDIQLSYYQWKGRRQSGKRWLVAVIKRLWDISWDLWNHRKNVRLAEEEAQAKNKARADIQAQFLAGTRDLLHGEFHLLTSRSLRDRLHDPLFRQQSWLRRIRGCRRRGALLRTQRTKARSHSLMQRWLRS